MSRWDPTEDPVEKFLEDIINGGLENSTVRRYYSKYEGVVVSNRDPQFQGRVQVRVFALKRRAPLNIWAYPSAIYAGDNYGVFFPPEEGDHVWVWFDHGQPSYPGVSGGWWLAPQRDAASSQVPEEFKTTGRPTIRGIKTKEGHGLLFDDDDGRMELWTGISQGSGVEATRRQQLKMSSDEVELSSHSGLKLAFDDVQARAELVSPGNIAIQAVNTVSAQGAALEHTFTGQATLAYNALNLQAQAASVISATAGLSLLATAGTILISGLNVQLLGLAAGSVILGAVGVAFRLVTETLIPLFNALVTAHNTLAGEMVSHAHPFVGNLGVPGVTSPAVGVIGPAAAPADLDSVTTNITRAN